MDFDSIYHEYKQKVYRLCLGYTNDESRAKDFVQETFISVWKNLDKFRGEANVGTWIYRIAANKCIKNLQRDKSKITTDQLLELKVTDPEESEQLILLRKFIAELPEIDRLIISMELEELPQAEIAAVLGMKAGNVRVRIYRIKEKLTNQFKTLGHV